MCVTSVQHIPLALTGERKPLGWPTSSADNWGVGKAPHRAPWGKFRVELPHFGVASDVGCWPQLSALLPKEGLTPPSVPWAFPIRPLHQRPLPWQMVLITTITFFLDEFPSYKNYASTSEHFANGNSIILGGLQKGIIFLFKYIYKNYHGGRWEGQQIKHINYNHNYHSQIYD